MRGPKCFGLIRITLKCLKPFLKGFFIEYKRNKSCHSSLQQTFQCSKFSKLDQKHDKESCIRRKTRFMEAAGLYFTNCFVLPPFSSEASRWYYLATKPKAPPCVDLLQSKLRSKQALLNNLSNSFCSMCICMFFLIPYSTRPAIFLLSNIFQNCALETFQVVPSRKIHRILTEQVLMIVPIIPDNKATSSGSSSST